MSLAFVVLLTLGACLPSSGHELLIAGLDDDGTAAQLAKSTLPYAAL